MSLHRKQPMYEGMEATRNKKGYMFLEIGESADHWLSSLPHSKLPLLDAGAAYGVHSIHAINTGRDVLALDADEAHLQILRERVAELPDKENSGTLIGTIHATLPSPNAVCENSVSGILLSEVLQFLLPKQVESAFKDMWRWLEPGGKLVATVMSWPPQIKPILEVLKWKQVNGLNSNELLRMLDRKSGKEILRATPGLMLIPEGKVRDEIGTHLYLMSTDEIRELCLITGYEIEKLQYYSPGKYPNSKGREMQEAVLLVARKPVKG